MGGGVGCTYGHMDVRREDLPIMLYRTASPSEPLPLRKKKKERGSGGGGTVGWDFRGSEGRKFPISFPPSITHLHGGSLKGPKEENSSFPSLHL